MFFIQVTTEASALLLIVCCMRACILFEHLLWLPLLLLMLWSLYMLVCYLTFSSRDFKSKAQIEYRISFSKKGMFVPSLYVASITGQRWSMILNLYKDIYWSWYMLPLMYTFFVDAKVWWNCWCVSKAPEGYCRGYVMHRAKACCLRSQSFLGTRWSNHWKHSLANRRCSTNLLMLDKTGWSKLAFCFPM